MASACNLPTWSFVFTIPVPIPTFKLPKFTFGKAININVDCPLD